MRRRGLTFGRPVSSQSLTISENMMAFWAMYSGLKLFMTAFSTGALGTEQKNKVIITSQTSPWIPDYTLFDLGQHVVQRSLGTSWYGTETQSRWAWQLTSLAL